MAGRDRVFRTTKWTVVRKAGDPEASDHFNALSHLCQTYWYPVYGFIRRQGRDHDSAADLTQSFFARLLEKNFIRGADRSEGKFRWFLLATLRNFLKNEHAKAAAQKRGAGATPIDINTVEAETKYAKSLTVQDSPETLFAKNWALTTLETARCRLRTQYADDGKENLFNLLCGRIGIDQEILSHRDAARRLEMTENAVKTAVNRLKRKFGQALRREVATTVDNEEDIDEEIRYLISVV